MGLIRATEIPVDRSLSWSRTERDPQHTVLKFGSSLGMKIACRMPGLELITQALICDDYGQMVATKSNPQLRAFAKLSKAE
jgi:hypothetical protein